MINDDAMKKIEDIANNRTQILDCVYPMELVFPSHLQGCQWILYPPAHRNGLATDGAATNEAGFPKHLQG